MCVAFVVEWGIRSLMMLPNWTQTKNQSVTYLKSGGGGGSEYTKSEAFINDDIVILIFIIFVITVAFTTVFVINNIWVIRISDHSLAQCLSAQASRNWLTGCSVTKYLTTGFRYCGSSRKFPLMLGSSGGVFWCECYRVFDS
jgi:hypothetical protein